MLSEKLRCMPRHEWDDYLREFCKDLVTESEVVRPRSEREAAAQRAAERRRRTDGAN